MINLENFDNLNLKLLNKLNEEYSLLSENNGDPFNETNTEQVLTDKIKKEENDAKIAFYNAQQIPPENVKAKESQSKLHAKAVIERENAKNLKRKVKLNESNDINDYSDEDFYFMAEEFDNDINSNHINKQKDRLEQKMNDIQSKAEEKINEISEKQEEQAQDADKNNELASSQLKQQQDSSLQTITQNTNKKIESIEKSAESKTNNIQRQLSKLDDMKNMHQQQKSMQEGWIKNMKKAIAEKKMDKLSKKEGDLIIKRRKIEEKINEAKSKGHDKKVIKFQNKIEKIDGVIEKIHDKFKKYDQKVVKLEESFLDDVDLLCIEADNLIESIELDPDYLEEDYAYNSLYQQYKDIIEYKYTDPMKIKIVKEIKSEFEKDANADPQKIKILIIKLKQYK